MAERKTAPVMPPPAAPVAMAPQKPANLKQWVATSVRSMIMNGEMRPGQRIDQDALAAQLGVSKLPVREALIVLAGDRLVEHVPHKGVFVASVDEADLRDHFIIYGVLSGLAAARAAKVLTPEDLARLHDLARRMEKSRNPHEQEELNHQFHATINKAGAGRRLLRILKMLQDTSPLRIYVSGGKWTEHLKDHHQKILDALDRRSSPAAEKAMREHLAEAGDVAVKAMHEQAPAAAAPAAPRKTAR